MEALKGLLAFAGLVAFGAGTGYAIGAAALGALRTKTARPLRAHAMAPTPPPTR